MQEIVELAGYTYRVATMLEVFEDCSAGRYQRNIVKSTKQGKKSLHHSEAEQVGIRVGFLGPNATAKMLGVTSLCMQ